MHCGTANTHDMQALVQTDTQSSTVSDRGVMQALVAYKQCKQKEMRRHCGAEKVNWKCKCIGLQTDAERDCADIGNCTRTREYVCSHLVGCKQTQRWD